MHDTLYEVYQTDADDTMDPRKLVHSGRSKDIAESRMFLAFQASGCMTDYLMYDVVKKHIDANCLSPETAMKKGICLG